jgi:hypothetical protein
MAYTESSTIRDIMAKPNGKTILEKYVGHPLTQIGLDQVYPMAIKALAPLVAIDQVKLTALLNELNTK